VGVVDRRRADRAARRSVRQHVAHGGRRFAPGSDIALPQSPLAFIPIGALVIAVGVVVYLV
jgi:hypothetical protein